MDPMGLPTLTSKPRFHHQHPILATIKSRRMTSRVTGPSTMWMGELPSLKRTASSHLKIGRNTPIGNEKLFQPSIFSLKLTVRPYKWWFPIGIPFPGVYFQGQAVCFREYPLKKSLNKVGYHSKVHWIISRH